MWVQNLPLVPKFIAEVDVKMFKPDLATVLANKFEIAEAKLSEYEAKFGDMLAKRNLQINYLAYFEEALGIPLKEINGGK